MKIYLIILTLCITGCSSMKEPSIADHNTFELKKPITVNSSKGVIVIDSISNCSKVVKNGQTDIRC